MLFQIFKQKSKVTRLQRLRGLHRASAEDFQRHPQSYEVTRATVLLQIFKQKSKVARLQRLRRLHRASAEDFQ